MPQRGGGSGRGRGSSSRSSNGPLIKDNKPDENKGLSNLTTVAQAELTNSMLLTGRVAQPVKEHLADS